MNSVEKSILFLDFALIVRERYSGDIMAYYIAQRNKETKKFELWIKNGNPQQWHVVEDAINSFELALRAEGHNNVKLLKSVSLDVDITVKKHEVSGI